MLFGRGLPTANPHLAAVNRGLQALKRHIYHKAHREVWAPYFWWAITYCLLTSVLLVFSRHRNMAFWTLLQSQSPVVQQAAAVPVSSHSLGFWSPLTLARGVTLQHLLSLQLWEHHSSQGCSNSWDTELLLIKRLATGSRQEHVNKY